MLFNSRAAELQDLYIKVINSMQSNIFSQQFSILTVFHEQIYYIYLCIAFWCSQSISSTNVSPCGLRTIMQQRVRCYTDGHRFSMQSRLRALTLLCDWLDSDVSLDPRHGWWNCFRKSCTHSHYLDIRSQQIFA